MAIDILMPALSPTMTEGKLAKWLTRPHQTFSAVSVLTDAIGLAVRLDCLGDGCARGDRTNSVAPTQQRSAD